MSESQNIKKMNTCDVHLFLSLKRAFDDTGNVCTRTLCACVSMRQSSGVFGASASGFPHGRTMSARRPAQADDMFHIQYPAKKDFLSWVELGCLARALGFPTNVVRDHLNQEIEVKEEGIPVQQLQRMIDLKLLHAALHRSCNHHTAEWNLHVIQRAVNFLTLNILSFEELHNIRLAYVTYEASDIKGLYIDQRTLLRTLKMCHRIISPKKLMHRVKHMMSRLQEPSRIQLYEFFDLILWCDYTDKIHQLDDVEQPVGKDNELYNMVEFEQLLSHQDQRRSRVLDERYLAEEWNFGRENLGSKLMFKDEVVHSQQRITQTHTQKQKYRGLKKAVNQSQRQVYRAHAGSIRPRPISAPNLSMYTAPRFKPRDRSTSAAAVYKSVQQRLFSAHSRASGARVSDKPIVHDYVRVHTPSVVTLDDLDDVKLKLENLEFDVFTLESRCQLRVEEEKYFYIPNYKPKPKDSPPQPEPQPEPKAQHWTPEIIDNLVHPNHKVPPSHAHACDARFRGWKPAELPGRHHILTVPTFDNSPNGRLLAMQRALMLAPVGHMHRDYVVRHTSKEWAEQHKQPMPQKTLTRPHTAPTTLRKNPAKQTGCKSATTHRGNVEGWSTQDLSHIRINDKDDLKGEGDGEHATEDEENHAGKSFPDPFRHHSADWTEKQVVVGEPAEPVASEPSTIAQETDLAPVMPSSAPMLATRKNRTTLVGMGLMGTIKLLESIQELALEEQLSETSNSSSASSSDNKLGSRKALLGESRLMNGNGKTIVSNIPEGQRCIVNGRTTDAQNEIKLRKDDHLQKEDSTGHMTKVRTKP